MFRIRSNAMLTALSIMIILSVVLTGCSSSTPTAAPTTAAPKAAATTAPAAPAATTAPAAPAATTAAPAAKATTAAATAPAAAPSATAAAAKATTAPARPAKLSQSPLLDAQVASGALPPLEQRLPENPLVVDAPEVGTYGGVWRRGFLGPSDFNGVVRVVYDALVRYGPDGASIDMKLAESVTPSADFKQWTVKLRKGSKWSDGKPFTADDIMFWYKDILQNKELMPTISPWMLNKDGSTVLVEKIDDVSVRWTYKEPTTVFLNELANKDNGDRQYPVFVPAHFLKQFHASYASKADLDKLVADAKLKTWTELFNLKQSPFDTPERPAMSAWVASNRISDQIFSMKRNPYYVGVDKAGNQLPYLDEVQFKFFADAQALNLAAIAGELDQQERHVNLLNFPVLKENETKLGKYKIYTWSSPGGADADVIFNQTYAKDPDLGKLFANKDFRIAMSYAINRAEIQQSAFLGTGEPRQPVPRPGHPYYPGDEYAKKYTEYNAKLANEMLDKLGLTKGADGMRTLNGKPILIELSVVPVFGPYPDIAQLIAGDFQDVGIKTNIQIRERSLHFQMRQANDLQAELWNQDTAGFPFTGSTKYDVRQPLYGNVTTGPLWKTWYDTQGKEGVEPPADVKRMVEIIDQAKTVGPEQQATLAKELFRIWVDGMYEIGTIGLTPTDQGTSVVSNAMHNVPTNLVKDWPLRTPGNGRSETFFLAK